MFRKEKGYGFAVDNQGQDHFFHVTGFADKSERERVRVGSVVEGTVLNKDARGPSQVQIKLVAEDAGKEDVQL